MKRKISWTKRCDDGVKREVRVDVTKGALKWQFKRADEERWDYDSEPLVEDWDELESILIRREGRGRGVHMHDVVRKHRERAGV